MAHYAEVNVDGTVLMVIVIDNDHESQAGGEPDINAWCKERFGGVNWVKTSYNASSRRKYAGIGDHWNEQRNRFEGRQPYPSWTLHDTGDWVAPASEPQEGLWSWNEDTESWVAVV